MARYFKRGMDASAIKEADAKVRETVESILAAVEARKDAAVRDLSEKFDKWSPARFPPQPRRRSSAPSGRSPSAISKTSNSPRPRCAISRRSSANHARPGSRDAARRHSRPPPYPGELDRLLRAGRALSDGRLRAHVDRHRAGRRREAHHRLRAAVQGRAASGDRRRHAFRRRRRNLRARRRAGGRRHGARHRDHRSRST